MRKILNKFSAQSNIMGVDVKMTTVIWCLVDSETKTAYKTQHLGRSVFIQGAGVVSHGVDARFPQRTISVLKEKSLESLNKLSRKPDFSYLKSFLKPENRGCDAAMDATRLFIMKVSSISKNQKATVVCMDKSRGNGLVKVNGYTLPIYACNINGAKTGFENTACVYFEDGQEIDVDIIELSGGLSVKAHTQGILDEEKWNKIKDKKLAFRRDENGKFINGIFE